MDYNIDYYQNLLRIHTATAKQISETRWKFIKEMCCVDDEGILKFPPTVLDYGCGVGWFAAFKPDWAMRCDTYDIMPVPQTGISLQKYDILTLFDVLEHIPDFTVLSGVLLMVRYVVISIPMKPDNVAWKDFKHFKPGEHLHYYSQDLLEAMFGMYGFRLQTKDSPECPPRENITTFVFKRRS